jgi:hypothetical protein
VVDDVGIPLEMFDAPREEAKPRPMDPLEVATSRERMARIERKLRATDFTAGRTPLHFTETLLAPPMAVPQSQLNEMSRRAARRSFSDRHSGASWLLGMMLAIGVCGLAAGALWMIWAAVLGQGQHWQWGMTTLLISEGTLIVGLLSMAARLWNNGRRVNRQLQGLDAELHQIHRTTGELVGSRLSTSQHYYHHVNQGLSPHLLVANLRGQVDQLAERMAT